MLITIDRLEGNFAICEMEDGKLLNLPKDFLPPGTREGSKLRIELDLDAEEKDRDRIKSKMNNLFKG
ncbi:DUF3006 domain-containing protein [Proteiniclasticum ruminis]|uniref:DUF3006 domain-containing protein n=1 Tax=Proteiniclasticum ruminis TaxID=398199 RepID=A0A1I4ZNC2_9CLOT|nr:DUF3006 domain-containing protein [Proteiniclasticum ruminis]SFN51755.1 Protein of unknown function [Proteiniclasticum ruminis]